MTLLQGQLGERQTDIGRSRLQIDRIALAIFLLALAARLLHIWFLRESPLFSHLLIDSVSFNARAVDFLNGHWLPREGAFYQAPLYPLFLSGVYRIFGHSLLAARIAQAFLGSGTAVLVYLIGRRCCGRTTGIVAGVIAALYAMAIHFDFEILRSSLVLFLGTLSLHLLLVASERRSALRWGAAGFVLGLGVIARPTLLAFVPLAVLWAFFRPGRTRTASYVTAVILSAAALAPPAAVTAVNYASVGQLIPVSINGGLNFYLGNNADYEQTVGMRPGTQWTLLNHEPGIDPTADPAGWSRYYYSKAAEYVRSEPLGYMALLVKKFVLFWNGHEIERNSSFSHIAEHSPVLSFPLCSFRWVAPLALVGLLIAWRRKAPLGLVALFLGANMVATVAFYICARHRLPAVPALYLFAAYGAVELAQDFRRNRRRAALYVLLIAALAVAVNTDTYGVSERDYARADYELAMIARRERRMDDALELLRSAREKRPNDPDPYFVTGTTLMLLDRHEEAAAQFERSAELEPRYAPTWYNLGLSLRQSGDLRGTERALRTALTVRPRYPEAASALGEVLEDQARYDEAARTYEAASTMTRNASERASALLGVARARWASGQENAALAAVDAAIASNPDPPTLAAARLTRASTLAVLGRSDEALAEAERLLELDPSNEEAAALREELRP